MSLKEQIVNAGKDLASSGESTSKIEPESSLKYWRAVDDANRELAPLGVSASWKDGDDIEATVVVLVKGVAPAPAPAPAPEPVVEVDVEKEEEPAPKRWGI
jgi:hypothetical protein